MNRRDISLMLGGFAVAGSFLSGKRLLAADGAAKINAGQRTGNSNGRHAGHAYTHIPALDVNISKADAVTLIMAGACAAGGNPLECSQAEIVSEITQHLRVDGQDRIKLTMDSHLEGQLWCTRDGYGVASLQAAEATLLADGGSVLGFSFHSRTHSGRDSLTINDKLEPTSAIVPPGEYVLVQRLVIEANHPKKCFHKNVALAYFGPEGGKPPEWLNIMAAHREAPKIKDMGFRVTLKAENPPVG